MLDRKFFIKHSGFTLIELIIALSIIGLLSTLGLAYYQDFNRRQIVVQVAKDLKNNLRLAQSKALTGEKDCAIGICGGTTLGCGNDGAEKTLVGWFVDFSTKQIYGKCDNTLFWPTSFAERIPSNVSINTINPIQFNPLTGGVNIQNEQTICISGFEKYYRLKITPSGEIKDDNFVSSPSCL